ncbi:hypothetical protein NB701_001264 [Pantoea ananatis]|nr:hypothetical protein [Pantoea ananatis]
MIYINAHPGLLESTSQKTGISMEFLKKQSFHEVKKNATSQWVILPALLSVFLA